MSVDNENLIWVDMEMTGLHPETDVVLEIASIVTDKNLNILAEGPVIAIHQPDSILDNMDQWCIDTHGKSGLTERCRLSKINEQGAVEQTLGFLTQFIDKGKSPMCGNTIGQDRRFMVKYMPELEAFFHYRNIDVSTIKELVKRWNPSSLEGFTKKGVHLAMDDIRESIAELVFYRQKVFTV